MMKIPVKLTSKEEYTYAIVDRDDYEYLVKFKWHLHKGTYAARQRNINDIGIDGNPCRIKMHRFVMRASKGQMIDHKNGNPLDNRKENLRFCTNSENVRNRGISKANTSGFKGVSQNRKSKKWQSMIEIDGKSNYLGTFDTKEEAYAAYVKVAKEVHGEFFHP